MILQILSVFLFLCQVCDTLSLFLLPIAASVLESVAGNKMNTLAVNRLLRQLESAIVGGEHQRAATLAKQLAKHKVSCCVTRQKQTDFIT